MVPGLEFFWNTILCILGFHFFIYWLVFYIFFLIRLILEDYYLCYHLYILKKIDLIKFDTEGHKLQVLKGSKNILKKNLIKYLLIEINTSKMYQNYNKKKIDSLLKKNNFVIVKKFKFPFHPFSDVLYKNSHLN